MDNHFNQGYMPSYPPPPNHAPQSLGSFGHLSGQGHQQDSPSHTTLPPLQNQNGGYQFGSLSYAHPGSQTQTPTTPHTPASASMQSNAGAYPHISPTNAQPGSMLPPSSFNPPYGMTQSMQHPSSTATSMPPLGASTGLPAIRPMPPAGLPSLSNPGQLGQHTSFMQNEEAPTHVVGSQGRRGILPSAPGRPNPPAQGSGQTAKSMIPQKDADGKFPCPHCNKTYLHAKHLKRHLLRHTGDRPYMCHLCKDTFSRSDILKRHFQKCSLRRGNPTGANHLAHQRRNTNGRLSISQQDGPIGLAGLQEVAGSAYNGGMISSPTVNGNMSTRTSRANSIITPSNMSHRNSVAGLGILGSNMAGSDQMASSAAAFQQGMVASAMPNSTSSAQMQPNYAFNNPQMHGSVFNNQQSQVPFLGQESSRFDNSHNNSPHQQMPNGDMDWNRMFSQGGQDGFIGGQPANASSLQLNHVKTEIDSKDNFTMQNDLNSESFLGHLYSHPNALGSEYRERDQGIPGSPYWSLDDPLQAKVDSLREYCFPHGIETPISVDPAAELVNSCLTVDGIKHFAEHYTSYHGHWPMLHIPTFKLTDANNALVMAMICIGAIYSPRLNITQTHQLMDFVKMTVMSNCNIYNRTINGQTEGLGTSSCDIEEMQALLMIQSVFMWHGEQHQRQAGRNEFPTIARIAKAMGLCQSAPPGHYAYSVLHSTQNSSNPQLDARSWNWNGWLEQEKRNRALYLLFLTDAAMAMYFNATPQFDPLEIRLMLPADDAAWDARDEHECASALGLFGPQAQGKNETGTRRPKQPGIREAMRTLLEPSLTFQLNSTNAYSKFVLIHALIVLIIGVQKGLLLQDVGLQSLNLHFSGSTPATPLSQNDWLEQRAGSLSLSAANSGRTTPTDGVNQGVQHFTAQQDKKRLGYALDKWKRNWDEDIEVQYPPSKTQLRRFGFSRDGVHFFFLGRSFLQSHRAAEWSAPADVRFKQVMGLLKQIKSFVIGDTKGQDIGSVGDIDEQYGLDNLTLDMKLLFKPYNSQIDSPVAGVQTHSL